MGNLIVIGIVAPLGTEKESFINKLKNMLGSYDYTTETISITDFIKKEEIENLNNKKFGLFLKMEICSKLREHYCKTFLSCLAVNKIIKGRNEKKDKKRIYIIDQLKHPSEYKLLSHVYGLAYIQISLFSNQQNRDRFLMERFNDDNEENLSDRVNNIKIDKLISTNDVDISNAFNDFRMEETLKKYIKDILPDGAHKLMKKDMKEIDGFLNETKSGQSVSDIFHLSHYFFNLDE